MAPELKRARLGVTLAFVVNGFTAGTFVARIPDIKEILAISDGVLGLSLLFVSIGVFVGLGPAGRNSARYGSRPVILWGTLGIVISLPIVGWLPSLGFAWFGLFIFGFALATQDVSMNAHAVVIEQRAGRRLMSTFHAMFSVGTLFGGILGGIFSQLAVTPLNQGYILALIYLLVLFFIRTLILPASVDQHPITKNKGERSPAIFWIFGIFGLFAALSEGAAGDWGGVLARDAFAATPFVSTLPYIVYTLAMVIGRLSGDFLAHKFGASQVIAAGGILSSVSLALGLIVGGIPALMISWFLLGIGLSVVIPLMFSAAGTLASTKYQGVISPPQAIARVSGVSYFGFVIGPPVIGFLAEIFELRWALFFLVALCFSLIFASRYAKAA
ncbi:MAG: MFS transporter [Actinomycetales bacterium]|nr:MFS transporter [Actinomycetales bacterium]